MADVSVSIDFNAPWQRLARDMQLSLEPTLLSLHALASLADADVPKAVSTNSTSAVPGLRLDLRDVLVARQHAERWLLANAFRDGIEHVAAFLEGLREANAALSLANREAFTLEEFTAAVTAPATRFDQQRFPAKLAELIDEGVLAPEDAERLRSINTARNCLVHAQGLVRDRHAGRGSRAMRVAWVQPHVVVRATNGAERPCPEGTIVEAGETVLVRAAPQDRMFELGARVHFTSEEFSGIWWTILQFGERSTNLLFAKARASGFRFAGS